MPNSLQPPENLSHLPYIIVRLHRDDRRYELIEPNKANTYDLGDAFAARRYLERVLGEYLGGRSLDSATAFGASQTIMSQNRAFGLDLCHVDVDAGITRKIDTDEDRNLLDGVDDDELLFISGTGAKP